MPTSAADTFPNELLIHARKQQGLLQMDLAEKLNPVPDKGTISRWHLGKNRPGPYNMAQLVKVLGRSERQLGYPPNKKDIPFWEANYNQNTIFTGRNDILLQLAEVHLLRNQRYKEKQKQREKLAGEDFDEEEDDIPLERYLPQALVGLGGIGKTQIAVEYAYRYKQEYHTIILLNASDPVTLEGRYADLARKDFLDLPGKDVKAQVKKVREWFASSYLTRWLFIFDNVDSPETLNYIFDDLLPQQYYGHVILTTRMHDVRPDIQKITVANMLPKEGATLLLRRAGIQDASERDRELALELSHKLDGLALALDQAGAYIGGRQVTLEGYIQRYETERTEVLRYRGKYGGAYPDSVATTWSLSFEKVRQANPLGAELLSLCAFLAPDAIPEELMTQGASELGPILSALAEKLTPLDAATEGLLAYSLIQRHPDTKTYNIHRLVQAVLQDSIDEDAQKTWAMRAVKVVNRLFPEGDKVVARDICQRLFSHAQMCIAHIEKWQLTIPEAAYLFYKLGDYLRNFGLYDQAATCLKKAAESFTAIMERGSVEVAQTLQCLGETYRMQEQYANAEAILQEAISIYEKVAGEKSEEVAFVLVLLALTYHAQRKFLQTETNHQRALAIRQQILPPDHPDIAHSLSNLAMLYADLKHYDRAEELLLQARDIRQQSLGLEHPDTANTLFNLARVYNFQGKYAEMEEPAKQAVAILEKIMGKSHPYTGYALGQLVVLYQKQGNYRLAETYNQQALVIFEQAKGRESFVVSAVLLIQARLCSDQGKYEEADSLYQRTLAIRERILREDEAKEQVSPASFHEIIEVLEEYKQFLQMRKPSATIAEMTARLQVLEAKHAQITSQEGKV